MKLWQPAKLLEWVAKWKAGHVEVKRPSWDDYHMSMAFLASTRSHDSQTKNGCVIVGPDNRLIGMGYNGFPPDMPDEDLPNTRPLKYKWMRHGERNAITCAIKRGPIPEGCTAYITGQPCYECLQTLHENGIVNLVLIETNRAACIDEESDAIFQWYVQSKKVSVRYITPCFDHLKSFVKE